MKQIFDTKLNFRKNKCEHKNSTWIQTNGKILKIK